MRALSLLILLATLGTGCKDDAPVDDSSPPPDPVDADSDGYSVDDDCDDHNPNANPGASEICDGIDNNCDGTADEGVLSTFYADTDGDGYGAGAAIQSCNATGNQVESDGDCDDANPLYHPGAPEEDCSNPNDYNCDGSVGYADADGDGYAACEECDDAEADVNPSAIETCDGIDNNCVDGADEGAAVDASTWYADTDSDGYGDSGSYVRACEQPSGTVDDFNDCDDTNGDINPDGVEVCDGADNNCDQRIDEDDAADASTWYPDADSDGYGDPASSTVSCTGPSGTVTDSTDCDDGASAINPAATEVCDSVDNNCDGDVDENTAADASTWYTDTDSDGYGDPSSSTLACDAPSGTVSDNTDCDDGEATSYPGAAESWYDGVDSDCNGDDYPDICLGAPGAGTVSYDSSASVSRAGTWSVVEEWATADIGYSAGSSYNQVMMTPVVGQTNDDNGDGVIDAWDTPDILFTTFTGGSYSSGGYLRVFSGDGSGELWSKATANGNAINGAAGVAVGDIDGDGTPEILTMSTAGKIIALDYAGATLWISASTSGQYAYPAIYDMDGDGCAEIAAGGLVVNCRGSEQFNLGARDLNMTFMADVDNDGQGELVTGDGVWDITGTEEVATSLHDSGAIGMGNFDSDDAAEMVHYYGGVLSVADDDGATLWTVTLASSGATPPCVADFDGDGAPEIGVASAASFYLVDTDGTTLWTATTYDPSTGSMTCSGFDFDGDGAAEVVYGDRTDLYVWDGATGTAIYTNPDMASGSIYENVVIADVDNDGQAEMVVPSNNYSIAGWTGVVVLGEENGLWASARNVWNQHAYTSANINDDMSIPVSPAASWLDGDYQGQQSWSSEPGGAPNLVPEIVGVCETCSAGSIVVYVTVSNTGSVFAPMDTEVSLYADSGGTRSLLDFNLLSDALLPGDRSEPLAFTVDPSDVGSDGLVVVLDEDGYTLESDETDNETTWDALTCAS